MIDKASLALLFIRGTAVANAAFGVVSTTEAAPPSLYDFASTDSQTSEFAEAIRLSGLSDTLDTRGPFTLFLPENSKFSELDQRYLDPQYKEHLENLVLLHSKFGRYGKDALTPGQKVVMSNAEEIEVTSTGGIIPSTDGVANLTRSNIQAENGIVHVIDSVLEPKFLTQNAASFVEERGALKFIAAAKETSVWDLLSDDDANYTLILPTERAMTVFESDYPDLRADPEQLEQILLNHLFDTVTYVDSEMEGKVIRPLSGKPYNILFNDGVAVFGGEAVAVASTEEINDLVRNGAVHIIDNVLLSPEIQNNTFAPAGSSSPTASPTGSILSSTENTGGSQLSGSTSWISSNGGGSSSVGWHLSTMLSLIPIVAVYIWQ